jgi:hypothetical protein
MVMAVNKEIHSTTSFIKQSQAGVLNTPTGGSNQMNMELADVDEDGELMDSGVPEVSMHQHYRYMRMRMHKLYDKYIRPGASHQVVFLPSILN